MSRAPINLIHAEVLTPYERALRAGGAPVESLFESCGIPLEAVNTTHSMVTLRQGYHLMEKASRYAGDEGFGSKVGIDLRLYELGALGHAVQQAPTLFDAGRVVMSAVRASEPGSQVWIEHSAEESWLCYRPVQRFDLGGAQAEQFDLEATLQLIRLVAGETWLPRKVRVSKVTAGVLTRLPNFSRSDVRQHSTMSAIAFPHEYLASPVSNPSETSGGATGWTGDSVPESALSASDAVGAVLESLFEFGPLPSLEVMARHLGINSRTLQRSLAEEFTSYRDLTERLMFQRAVNLLEEQELSIKTISLELGYCSPSSFVRAFGRIAGITPVAYRNRKLERQ